ncbi:MAG: magnesium transporter CorA family protein [Burkholderiaceae bacterium]|jgi:Mg2+ and Co2+ transporter CorA|nr:magnesium transporter CorA family protein [Burkholderiaceae bacterium]
MELIIVGAEGASVVDALNVLPDGAFVWCDCVYADGPVWTAPVQQLTGIHVLDEHLRDAENVAHPSSFDSTNDYEIIVFRGLALRVEALDADDVIHVKTRPVVFFLFPRVLVTVRAPDSRLMASTRTRLMSAAGRTRLPSQPEELMLRILNAMIDRYLELRQPLSAQYERWQRQLLDTRRSFSDWYSLLEARREVRRLEDLCEEQLDAIQEWRDERLEHHEGGGLGEVLLVRTSDLVEHIHRVRSHAQRLESSLENAVQLHFSATAYRTNEIVRALTAITAVFMPLTLITGIFGMNFEYIPWLHSRAGFWWTMGAMFALGVLMLLFLRAREVLSASALLGNRSARRRRRRRDASSVYD